MRLFLDLGASLGHVVISHTDRKPEPAYHREILSTGVVLEYDSAFRWPSGVQNPTRNLVLTMFAEGFGDQIVLGMDAARRKYWRGHGGTPGIAYLLREFVPQFLSSGLSQSEIERIFIQNPARCYAFHHTTNSTVS